MMTLFQPNFTFIVLHTLTDEIDSNIPFIVSAIGTFSGQIESNLIEMSVFLILLLVDPIQIPFHFHSSYYFE